MLYTETKRKLFSNNGKNVLSVEPCTEDEESLIIEFDNFIKVEPNSFTLTLDEAKELIKFLNLSIEEIESQREAILKREND